MAAAAALLLLTAGCVVRIGDFEVQLGEVERVGVGDMQREQRDIPLGDIESATVEIGMGVGRLRIEPGAEGLVDAQFAYNVEEWRPKVEYREETSRGVLSVEQPINVSITGGGARNEWDLRLTGGIPMDLRVRLGAGDGRLDLRGLQLQRLEVEMGAGEVDIDLRGAWKQSFEIRLRRGVGEATLRLPSDVGVRVQATSVMGQVVLKGLERRGDHYVNAAYGETEVTLNVNVIGAVGTLNLEVED